MVIVQVLGGIFNTGKCKVSIYMFKFQKAKEIRYGKVKDRLSIRCKWSNRGEELQNCSGTDVSAVYFQPRKRKYKRKGREKALENSNIMADKDLLAN